MDGPFQVLSTTPLVKQAADGLLKLKVADCDIIGHSARLETKAGDVPNIGYWVDPKDYLEWNAEITKPGAFDVELEYACDPGSSGECALLAGGQTLNFSVPATKSWSDFATASAGRIQIEKAGPITLTLKPVKKQGEALMNLRAVILKRRD